MGQSPRDAWEKSTERIFGKGTASQRKACPRGTFLGLCEEGLINIVEAGNYCRSQKNKDYAVKAVEILKHNPELANNKNKLWDKIAGSCKAQNNQMDVAIALWERGLIRY
ncbi:MAG: hypothetical protein Q7I98_05320 [Erysipelotrichaceae bacterium]|nr:hypothetical protein [Erysipelotrichaceae bacterium]